MRQTRLILSFFLLFFITQKQYAQILCSEAQPVCANNQNIFPGANTASAQPGPFYGCLQNQPRPSWHTIQVANSGNLTIVMSGTGNSDIDYICYGPFTSMALACANISSGTNVVGCSYSGSATETLQINGAVAGQYYLILVTNFINTVQDVMITQSGGSGSLNCSNVCDINSITNTVSSCYSPNTYSVTGFVSVNGAPTVGSLTITNSCGGTPVVYSAPFPSAISYAFANLPANGNPCSITAKFSALTTCSLTTIYTAPSTPTLNITASNNPLCIPGSATLSASGSTGTYTWSTGATGSSIVESPAVAGIYGYTVSSSTTPGCVGRASINLTAAVTPTVLAFSIPGFVCSGASATLIGTGANTFTWQPGGMTGNTVGINPTVSTNYSVTGTFGACTNTATTFVNVISGPALSVTTTSAITCPAQSVTLTASGALSYTWLPGGTIAPSIVVSPNSTTTYSVVGVNAFGCTSTLVVTQTVNPIPNVVASPASATVCAGMQVALSGSGATSYTWNPGNLTGANVSVLPSANTVYTLTGSNGTCSNTALSSITVVPVPLVGASTSTNQICSGGTATLTGSGATSYVWNPGGLAGTNVNVSPLTTTQYTVTGSANSCTNTAVVTVSVINGPAVTAVANPTAICPGGTATLSASGATSYTWNPGGQNTPNISVSPAATTLYTVTGANASGCLTIATINLVVNPAPSIGITASSFSVCAGSSATLTATGATSYTWNPGNLNGTTIVVTPLANTIYTVTGRSAAGCIGQSTSPVAVVALPAVTASGMPSSVCAGKPVTLTATGANNYTWNPGNISGNPVTVNPVVNTVYTVTGEASGCSNTATTAITITNGPTVTASASPATICNGGSATLTAGGAVSYTWNPGNLTGSPVTVSPASNTNYTVTGTDASGCTSSAVTSVSVSPVANIAVTASSPSVCAGSNVTLTASGAVSYSWTPVNMTGASIVVSPLVNTTYTVTGPNASGCFSQTVITIAAVPVPTINASATPTAICNGETATLNAFGATSYTWMPGNLSGASVNVSPAVTTNYTVSGSNAGCSASNTVSLVVNNGPFMTATPAPANICPGNSSTLTVVGTGVSYTWEPGGLTGNVVTVTPAATTVYTLTGTSASGCTLSVYLAVIVSTPPSLVVSSSSPSICAGGTATLSASGAISYTWNPGNLSGSSVVVTPATSTTYTVTGANIAGCNSQSLVAVTVVPLPAVSAASSPTAICAGQPATLTGSGATSYTWNPGNLTGTSVIVTPAATTVYNVTGSASGCSSTANVTVFVNPNPVVTATASPATICPGGTSTLTASGAVSYTWMPGNLTGNLITVSPSATTLYTVTGQNASGCLSSAVISVSVSSTPNVLVSASSPTICSGGTATLSASGAATYVWLPMNTTGPNVVVMPTANTTYTVRGTNASGCSAENTIAIVVVTTPTITVSPASSTICAGGTATLTAMGATNYTWNPGGLTGTSIIVSPATTTLYLLTGNSGGCTGTGSATVFVTPRPVISANPSPANICPGGSSTITANGALTYTLEPGTVIGNPFTVSPSSSTTYTITGRNAAGCSGTVATVVNVSTPPALVVSASANTVCAGSSVTLAASGANSYVWNPGALNNGTVTVTPATTTNYTVTGFNAIGCASQSVVNIVVIPAFTVNASAFPASVCAGSSSTLSASGAATYTWQPGTRPGQQFVVTPAATTNYTVTGSSGICTNSAIVTVTVNSAPSLIVAGSHTNICAGASATIGAIGATSYTWEPGTLTGPNIVVSPAVTTVYTVTGSNGAGCSATAPFTLNVSPAFTVSASASSLTVCQGFTTALTATGATSYTWYPGGLVGSTIVETPLTTTTYTVDGANGSCINSTVITVVVIPLPVITASANPAVICAGNTTTLTASGASSYTWIPTFRNGATITDTPAATTEYTVVGFSASGCPNFAVVSVTVLSIPVVTISASSTGICAGQSATLTGTGAISYTWNPVALFTETIVVTPAATTIYTLTGDNGSCSSGASSATIEIVVNALPVITAAVSSPTICSGTTVTLTANGASTYSWDPIAATGANVTDNPQATVMYTVTGTDINGCTAQDSVNVFVNPSPVIIAATSATAVCPGGSVTLTASGAVSYLWEPLSLTGATVTDMPANNTTYTVTGTDALGCEGTETITVEVVPVPVLAVTPNNAKICANTSITLTASGATSYTWLPSGTTGSVTVETPSVTSNYTVIGDNGGGCPVSFTVDVITMPLPANVTASASGTITCATPTVDLTGGTSSPNVSYSWNGPLSYTSDIQNPLGVTAWGIYTLSVIDNATGCTNTATVDVPTDNSIPFVTATTSGSITCSVSSVTLDAIHTTTNPAYSWSGPNGFTGTQQTFTVSVPGTYTVTVTDLTSTCKTTTVVTVGSHTNVTITASISSATCSAGIANNDGTITLFNFGPLDKFDLVSGASYTGTATYATAALISQNGIATNNLANPTTTLAYTIRLFDDAGCIKDTVLILQPTDCTPRSLGVAKDVSAPTLNTDGTYNVTYTVVVKNYDTAPMTNISLNEDLAATFPAPATFTVSTPLIIDSLVSGLVKNAAFNGRSSTGLTDALSSTLAAGQTNTIVFNVQVKPNGTFGPFKNSVAGVALTSLSLTVRDSSNTGMNPDPDADGDPTNNNVPTIITFTPNLFFGITKTGTVSAKLSDNSYDIAYTIRVHNLGNDTLYNVVLKDSLFANTIKSPAAYTIKTGPSSDGSLLANAAFNGNTDINLVDPLSKMAPGLVNSISFVINVTPDTVSIFSNSAYGNCITRDNRVLSDTSNAGFDPDSNNNGIWNEPEDNKPTVLTIKTHSLFIPQGFSPNGDAINQFFVIQGLPTNGDNELTVFNRWGNKVYHKANYDNTWEGYPNVSGIIGSDKLPQGTYYYILEMKGSGQKPITGFIVLEY